MKERRRVRLFFEMARYEIKIAATSVRDAEERNDDAMTRLSESGRIKTEWRILYSVMRNQGG